MTIKMRQTAGGGVLQHGITKRELSVASDDDGRIYEMLRQLNPDSLEKAVETLIELLTSQQISFYSQASAVELNP